MLTWKKKSNLPCNGRKQVRRLLQSSKTMLKDELKNPWLNLFSSNASVDIFAFTSS